MKKVGNSFELSATDLVGYLNCHHLAGLDRAVAEGALSTPKVWDPLEQILSERCAAHERSYIEYLTTAGPDIVWIDGVDVTTAAVADTLSAMRYSRELAEEILRRLATGETLADICADPAIPVSTSAVRQWDLDAPAIHPATGDRRAAYGSIYDDYRYFQSYLSCAALP
jgi:hypothetical protein